MYSVVDEDVKELIGSYPYMIKEKTNLVIHYIHCNDLTIYRKVIEQNKASCSVPVVFLLLYFRSSLRCICKYMYVNRVINYDDPKLKPRTGCHQFKLHPECPEIATYIYICIQGFVDRYKYIYIYNEIYPWHKAWCVGPWAKLSGTLIPAYLLTNHLCKNCYVEIHSWLNIYDSSNFQRFCFRSQYFLDHSDQVPCLPHPVNESTELYTGLRLSRLQHYKVDIKVNHNSTVLEH